MAPARGGPGPSITTRVWWTTRGVSRRAIEKARASRTPVAVEPGRYTVIMEPQAVGDLCQLIAFYADARATDEGRSPFVKQGGGTKVGEKILDERISMYAAELDAVDAGDAAGGDLGDRAGRGGRREGEPAEVLVQKIGAAAVHLGAEIGGITDVGFGVAVAQLEAAALNKDVAGGVDDAEGGDAFAAGGAGAMIPGLEGVALAVGGPAVEPEVVALLRGVAGLEEGGGGRRGGGLCGLSRGWGWRWGGVGRRRGGRSGASGEDEEEREAEGERVVVAHRRDL
jgi:hypothetical protein